MRTKNKETRFPFCKSNQQQIFRCIIINCRLTTGSLNHFSNGAMAGWLFSTICGIIVDGENHFFIVPKPGGHITHAMASCNSVCGLAGNRWEKAEGHVKYSVAVPANCTAKVMLDGKV